MKPGLGAAWDWVGDQARLTAPGLHFSALPAPGAPWGRQESPRWPPYPRPPPAWPPTCWGGQGGCSAPSAGRTRSAPRACTRGSCGRPAACTQAPAPARHTLTLGHTEDTGAPGRIAAPLFASGGGKLSQRDDHERQHHAGGQQGGDDDGRDGAGPQRACRTEGGSARPPASRSPPSPPSLPPCPPSAAWGCLVPLPGSRCSRAVLSSGRGGAVGAGAPVAAGSRAGLVLSTGPSPEGRSAGSFHRVGTGSCGPSAARPRTGAGAPAASRNVSPRGGGAVLGVLGLSTTLAFPCHR